MGAEPCGSGQLQEAHVLPIGAPIDTIAASSRGVRIDGKEYLVSRPPSLVHLVIVDRCTLSVRAFPFDYNEGDLRLLKAKLDSLKLDARSLVILAAPLGMRLGSLGLASLNKDILEPIGAPPLTLDQSGQPFSVIGGVGWPLGSAFRNIGGVFGVAGNLSGYLREDPATLKYDMVFSNYVPFTTQAGTASATEDTILVGDSRYTVSLPPGSTAGFHVLALNATNLTSSYLDLALPTNSGSAAKDLSDQQNLASVLKRLSPNALVFVQSIGKPGGDERTAAWGDVAAELERLGGTRAVFNALDGKGGYALVGRLDMSSPPAEVSQILAPKDPAKLQGLLARSRDSRFEPLLADPLAKVNDQLIQVLYQKPQPFEPFEKDRVTEARAAELYIGKKLRLCGEDATTCDVRADYYRKFGSVRWGDVKTDLLALKGECPNGATLAPPQNFTAGDCEAVRAQLFSEVADLARVQNYVERLQSVFLNSSVAAALVDLKSVETDVLKEVPAPAGDSTLSNAFEVTSYLSKLGAFLPPPGSTLAAGLSAGFSVAAYFSKPDDSPNLLDARVKAKVNELGKQVFERYQVAADQLGTMGEMIASDAGKLKKVGGEVYSNPAWVLPSNLGTDVALIRKAAVRWFYQTLMPVAYSIVRVDPPPPAGPDRPLDYVCKAYTSFNHVPYPTNPLRTESDNGWDRQIIGFRADGSKIDPVFALTSNMSTDPFGVPSAELVNKLFSDQDAPLKDGIGFQKLTLLSPRYFSVRSVESGFPQYHPELAKTCPFAR